MIDFDVVTGPNPTAKPSEPALKRAPAAPAKQVPATLPRAALLPRTPSREPPEPESGA